MSDTSANLRGARIDEVNPGEVRAGVDDALAPVVDELSADEEIVLVPDVHYPYHPSTGMVTDPLVVGELLSHLHRRLSTPDVSVCVRSRPGVDGQRVAGHLGYDDLTDATNVTLATISADASDETVTEALDGRVLTVPSARLAAGGGVAGGLALLAETFDPDWDGATVEQALSTLDPVGTLVDGTVTYTGDPFRAGVLLSGTDLPAGDLALARLLGTDPETDPALSSLPVRTRESASVDGLDIDQIAALLPDGTLPASRDPHPLVRAGYQLYTLCSGDIYPPQLEGD